MLATQQPLLEEKRIISMESTNEEKRSAVESSSNSSNPQITIASPFPPVGFPGFPISTIETYADPSSLR